jgi:2-amino-4-hydroxy-6-hydroxymethyldihydropteridine diphosphokinase
MPKPAAPRVPHTAAIALGSNLSSTFGDPTTNLHEALGRIEDIDATSIVAVSSFHTTDPVGYLDQPHFVNAAALVTTTLPAADLLHRLLAIEQAMGRDRTGVPEKGPRIIDLDLLLYDDFVLSTSELTLPHPAMHERRFVLAPLAEIAPTMRHPSLHRSIADLLEQISE